MSKHILSTEFLRDLTQYQDRLFAYILTMIGNIDDARDVLQDVNQCILKKVDKYNEGTSFLHWARKIAYFEIQAYWRDKGRSRFHFDVELLEHISEEAVEVIDRYDERLSALRLCIEKLPSDKQKLLAQRYQKSLSIDDVAKTWKRSSKAIVMLLSRVRLQLFDCIQKRLAENNF
tara:strand:- start:1616 stop:2140 length:525 start_codon:yes stop_codon:yes gene_type:complete